MNGKTNFKMLVLIYVVIAAMTGLVWNVSNVYGQARPEYPSDGAIITGDGSGGNIYTKLVFIPDASAVEHTGYFSEDYNEVAGRVQDANLGAPPYGHMPGWEYTYLVGNPGVPPAVDPLVRGTKYYWIVDETDALGNTLAGDVWEFTIQGFKASLPNPPNEAKFVETDLLLSWSPGFGVEEHDVYLGTDLDSVELVEFDFTVPPPEFVGTTSEVSILVTGLTEGVKYYWRVDQVNGRIPPLFLIGTHYKGDVWCFTTIPEGVGTIREDLWWGIAGDAVSDLLSDPRYPGNPDETRMLTSFDSGIALGDDYGGQIHGWLHPAKSGEYTFWLCSDDSSELFLSTDHTLANKVRIAYIEGWANPYDWYNQSGTDNPYQQSAPISLVGGRKYYIMARWKEDYAGDHCMVAWQGPDQPQAPVYGSSFAVIKGNRLSPFAQLWAHDPDPCDGQVSVESPVTLRWSPGDNADEHDVYVGTDKALVESRAPSVYKGRIDSNSYNLSTVLSGMIYYWAIDEVSYSGPSPGIWQGDVWSFTTKPAPIFVDDDAVGANDGSSWADAYNSLQDGLARADSSVKPVEIRVAQGIYKPTLPPPPPPPGAPPPPFDRTATFQLINGVVIKGGYAGFGEADPNARDIDVYETILSGDLAGNDVEVADPCDLLEHPSRDENSYHVVTGSSTDETAVLDGFTITCGSAEYRSLLERFNADNAILIPPPIYGPENWGGGLYNSRGSPTVSSCTFTKNTAYSGGAIYNRYNSSPMLIQCTFNENIAKYGGGMYNSQDDSILTNLTFNGNVATGSGGGIFSFGPILTLTDCLLTENSAGGSGGAICNGYGNLKMTNCTLRGNCANYNGGGIYSNDTNATLVYCTLNGNYSGDAGGGMYNYRSNLTLTNCIFSGNSGEGNGGGIYCRNDSLTRVINCTFAVNSALIGTSLACDSYGPEYPSSVQVTNSIFWDGDNEIWNNDNSVITIAYSDIRGGWPGTSNIDADPCFVDEANADYHLLPDSPCINAGDNNSIPPDTVDLDSDGDMNEPIPFDLDCNPRVVYDVVDMGAYEFFNTPPVADAGDNQVVECACNTAEGTKVTLDGSGSYDVDGDALTYRWTGPFAGSPTDGVAPTVTLQDGCPGEYVITLVVNDGTEDSEPNEVVITVLDTTPPEFTFSVAPTMLWPPNKKMVEITPSWTVSDDCDTTPDVSLVSVSMNESETGSNGQTNDDIQIGEDGTIYVRAERNRTGDRIYTITYQAVDDSGNAAVRSATVTVPRKRS